MSDQEIQARRVLDKLEVHARVADASEVKRTDLDVRMTPQVRRAKIDAIRKLIAEIGLSNGQLANAIGRSVTVVRQVLNDQYTSNPDPNLHRLHQKLHDLKQVKDGPGHGEFVTTTVAREVFIVIKNVIRLGTIGAMWGPAGVGKSLALRASAQQRPDSLYLEVMGHWTAAGLAEHLAHAMGVPVSGQLNTSRTVHRILQRLTGSHRLLIFDEAHLLRREAMTLVRQIHDASGCPVVLAGVPGLLDRILAGRGDRMQGATLYSRVGLKYDLTQRCIERGEPLYSLDDVRAFFESLKLVVHGTNKPVLLSHDALQWLWAVACLPADDCDEGGLRAGKNVLRLAYQANHKTATFDDTLTREMLTEASSMLIGTGAARHLNDRVQLQQRRGVKSEER